MSGYKGVYKGIQGNLRVHKKYITQWRYSVNCTRKLEFYNTLKHCYEISGYLNLTRKTITLVKLRVSNHKLMIETGRYTQTPHDKRLCPVCDSNEIEDEIHLLCYCPKYFKLRNEFFAQIQSHLHNFQQLSYSDLVIKLMNSEDIYLNLRLTNYISLLNNLHDSILSSKNGIT